MIDAVAEGSDGEWREDERRRFGYYSMKSVGRDSSGRVVDCHQLHQCNQCIVFMLRYLGKVRGQASVVASNIDDSFYS